MDPAKWEELGHPDAEMDRILAQKPLPSLASGGSVEANRKLMLDLIEAAAAQMPPLDFAGVKQETLQIPMRDGTTVRALKFSPENSSGPGPLVVNLYGGGFVCGVAEIAIAFAPAAVTGFGATYIAPEYRRAPEHKFPCAVYDTIDATKWIYDHATELNADPAKGFILAGASAGGLLAANASLWARDNGVPVTGVHLFSPAIMHHDSVPEKWKPYYKSREQCKNAPILDQKALDFFYGNYEPDPNSPFANLLLWETGLKNVAPTYLWVAGNDPLRDEALIYETVLRENGNKTKVDAFPGLIHCHMAWETQHSQVPKVADSLGAGLVWLLTGAP